MFLNKNEDRATQIGLHSVKNMLGSEMQLSLFSDYTLEKLSNLSGIKLVGKIDRFGIDLTDIQFKIMEGVLRGFTETNYKGNIEPIKTDKIENDKHFDGELPQIYKYLKEIPRLRATQSNIMDWAGVNKNSISEKERAVEALGHLGTAQYCFYYDRLAYDQDGVPEKDRSGRWKKEEVTAVDSLFTIKEIREDQSGILKYYEIEISPIFLDQRESYFVLIPYNWREEVKAILGNRKTSSYIFRFLLFLRYQYEVRRRSPKLKSPFSLKLAWEEIAVAIKMPESVYKRQKARAYKVLGDAYSVAKQLGYLNDYERDGYSDVLIFNAEKYYPKSETIVFPQKQEGVFSVDAERLFEFFHSEKMKIDKGHTLPVGITKKDHLQEFENLIKSRSVDEIFNVIKWGLSTKYWCTRLGTPAKLKSYFSEAICEMKNSSSSNQNEEIRIAENKKMAQEISYKLENEQSKIKLDAWSKIKVDALSKYVEIGNGIHQPTCIDYKEKGFKEQFENAMRKWGVLKFIKINQDEKQ